MIKRPGFADNNHSPVSDAWRLSFTPQNCLDQATHLVAASVINTVSDFVIVLLPIKTVLGLRLPKGQRVIVYLLFSGGIAASISGGVRTYFTWLFTSSPDRDTTWIAYYVMLTSSIELFIGIVSRAPARLHQNRDLSYLADLTNSLFRYVPLSRPQNHFSAATSLDWSGWRPCHMLPNPLLLSAPRVRAIPAQRLRSAAKTSLGCRWRRSSQSPTATGDTRRRT